LNQKKKERKEKEKEIKIFGNDKQCKTKHNKKKKKT
jgi:hypothetical protein